MVSDRLCYDPLRLQGEEKGEKKKEKKKGQEKKKGEEKGTVPIV